MVRWNRVYLTAVTLIILSILLSNAKAAAIISCTLDRAVYNQGETGYITLTVYNDKDVKIRVYEVTATINYFYADGTTYLQTFFTNATLPIEISPGQSQTFCVSFILPTNIAPGYAHVLVRARTEIWNAAAQRWYQSDNPTAEIYPYIESPYKQQYEQQRIINQQLQEQIEEQENIITELQSQVNNLQAACNNMTILAYAFLAITIGLGIAVAFVVKTLMKPRAALQLPPQ